MGSHLPDNQPDHTPLKTDPPPRAFAQGVGVLLQAVGGLFLLSNVCICVCTPIWDPAGTFLKIDTTKEIPGDPLTSLSELTNEPAKAGLMATILGMAIGGLALAGFGLGLQSDRRRAAASSLATCTILTVMLIGAGAGLWIGHGAMVARIWHGLLLALMFVVDGFVIAAFIQVRANPPPPDADVLPPGYKIPYSMYHDDPPAVRLARDLAERRARLAAEQKELDALEKELDNRRSDAEDE